MDFHSLKHEMSEHLKRLFSTNHTMFTTEIDKDLLYNTYLDSFPSGKNEVYRERREYDCSACKAFIRQFGSIVAVVNNKIVTIWDFEPSNEVFKPVITAMAALVRSEVVKNVFLTREAQFGIDKSHESLPDGTVRTWQHFYVKTPEGLLINRGRDTEESVASLVGSLRDTKNVFKRSLEELSQDSVETLLDLEAQKSLYKGEEWKGHLKDLLACMIEYKALPDDEKDNYCWTKSIKVGGALGRIRNHSIGVLLQDITSGMELDDALKRYEKIVAPTHYKRPTAVFTQKMVENAQKTIEKLGFMESLPRRYATLDDIRVNNVLFANRDAAQRMGADVFAALKQEVTVSPKKLGKIEDIDIDTFLVEVLPNISSMEVLMENRHSASMVSLIAPVNKDAKPLFKWGNNFSWAYQGNITDSMKERVKAAGGNVDGVLRFSIQWNENKDNEDDLDAHCREPKGGTHIEYPNAGIRHRSSGMLDVDIRVPDGKIAVENIIYTDKTKMPEGIYHFYVHNYTSRGARSGFSAEIEFDGQIFSFEYALPLKQSADVTVAKVSYSKEKGFEIVESLDSTVSSKEIWGVKTQQFVPASVFMFSPNYWDEQRGIGHRHHFFMLKGCKNPDQPNGFFNEFLNEALMEHKRVFEALGSKMRVQPVEDQLSGLGFSATKRNNVVVKVGGSFTRTLNITF